MGSITLFAASFIITDVTAKVSPAITCCQDNGGTYQYATGLCKKGESLYPGLSFYEENCDPAAAPAAPIEGERTFIAPPISCCQDNGGTYQVVRGGESGDYGVCITDQEFTDGIVFLNENCPTGTRRLRGNNASS